MYIESVYAVSFGSLKNVSLDLTSGMNIVEGRNESGKSTFGDLIRFIFYGLSAAVKPAVVMYCALFITHNRVAKNFFS